MASPDTFASSTDSVSSDWATWHEARERSTSSPFGLAALAATHWLTAVPEQLDSVPGLWHAGLDGIVGEGSELNGLTILQGGRPVGAVTDNTVTLMSGQDIEWGDRRLRFFERDGALALRVLDPEAPTRTKLRGIEVFEPDPALVLEGSFSPSAPNSRLEITAIDGHVSEDLPAGVIAVPFPDGAIETLTVVAERGGLHAVFGDETNGTETYGFRFIDMPAPDADGHVTVDFNRAYLPPCAFADFYVCPLPPAGNRLGRPIRAGEKNVRLEQ
ncbi:DUF1684 domain-containing protein [Mycetocola zhujimingii]|uniref:DUF1684 domain-containing protein n=1 Tax=Mycetocola zhujimingii TaxID=2079792 RepID=UPI000D355D87|nr:DUF1684 domain-containing protein [Mycetocola zhujimingii]AWB87007.1 hypothetical protein C3E77_10515 [Mycetocola zhujimingii]